MNENLRPGSNRLSVFLRALDNHRVNRVRDTCLCFFSLSQSFALVQKKKKIGYLFGSNSNDNEYDNIELLNRARLPENPEVNQAGHPNTYNFLIIIKLL